jgi:hypothetical protein
MKERSYLKKGRHTLSGHVSLLPNSKKIINRIFSMGYSLRQYATCLLAHICTRMCANGHPTSLAQKVLFGAQAVLDLQSP